MNIFKNTTEKASSIGLGFLLALSITSIWHFIDETQLGGEKFVYAILSLVLAGLVGYLLSEHLSVCTHKHDGGVVDKTFVFLVVLGSLIHTALDGLVVHESFESGITSGLIVLSSVIFHEIIRTMIVYKVIRVMGFGKILSLFTVFGVSFIGIMGGFFGSSILEGLHDHEALVELISGSIFFVVAIDLFLFTKHHNRKPQPYWFLFGLALYILITILLGGGH